MKFMLYYGLFVLGAFAILYLIIFIARSSEKRQKGYILPDMKQFSETDRNYIEYIIEKPLFPLITRQEAEEVMVIIKIGRACGSQPAINRLYEYLKTCNEGKGRKSAFFTSTIALMEENKIISNEEAKKAMEEYFKKEKIQ